jgi:RHS repeat-associated protein
MQYNSVGEITEVKTYHNASWLYLAQAFDAYGNVLSRSDPSGIVTSYAYSATYSSAYLTSVTRGPATQVLTYDFGTGLRTSKTDPRSFTTSYSYDLLGRVTSVIQPSVSGVTPTTTYVYDDVNNVATAYDPDSLPRILHYDMETNLGGFLEDLSGHGLSGLIYGTTSAAGKYGSARNFTAASDKIRIASTSGLPLGSSPRTISAWVKPTSVTAEQMVVSYGPALTPGDSFALGIDSTGKLFIDIYNGRATSTLSVGTGSLHFVAATYSGGSQVTLYLDASTPQTVSITFGGPPITPNTAAGNLIVGQWTTNTNYDTFKGVIDEVQIFNRALGTSTMSSVYGGTQPGRYLKTYYDGLGRTIRLVQRTFFSGPSTDGYHQETYTANWQDRIATFVNANGSMYRTAFDFLGRATTITNPDSSVRTTSYDDVNRLVTMTDEVGRVTQNVYDVAGRLTNVRQYYSSTGYNTTTYGYDLAGELLSVADPLGQTTQHKYDDGGRLVQTAYPDGTSENYVYDNLGNLIAKTDRAGRKVRYAYDVLNRLTSGTYPGGNQVTYTYDNDGNVRTVLNGTASLYFYYDNLNRLTTRSLYLSGDSTNYSVSYVYDAAGNLLNLTYPDGQGTLVYTYDPFYRVTSMSFGGSAIGSFTYRKDDLPSTIAYGDSTQATYVFNDRGFPLADKVTTGSTTLFDLQYSENAGGDVTGIMDKAAVSDTETFGYDKQDRLASAIGPWGTVAYGYDAAGNRLREDRSVPTLSVLRPNADAGTDQWALNGCTAHWACVAEAGADGDGTFVSTTTIGGTDLYRLPTLPGSSKGVEYVEVTAVARDTYTPPPPPPRCPPICPTGPETSTPTTGVGILSGTDDAIYLRVNSSRGSYRSLGNTYGTYTQRWTTDPATGQPWTMAAVNALQAGVEAADVRSSLRVTQLYVTVKVFDGALYMYSAGPTGTNELTSVNRNGAPTSFGYDANGNNVNRVTSSATTAYTFDLENRLVKACTSSPCVSANTYAFAYDGVGNRVREIGPSGGQTYTNTYVASGDQMLYLKNVVAATTTKTVYLYAGSLLVATVSGATKSYFHEDHLGNTRLVTQGGSVVFSSNYEPFGVPYAASGTDPSVKYTGQWAEAAGLYWNHARFYDPTLGRFVSADPILGSLSRPQTQNRYAYVANNPMRWLDPSGLFLEGIDWASVGALLAGAAVMAGAIALCATGVGCIGVIAAFAIAGAVGAGTAVAITAVQGRPVGLDTAVNGALLGVTGAALVNGAAGAGIFGPAAAEAASTMEAISAGTLASISEGLLGRRKTGAANGGVGDLPSGSADSFAGVPRRVELTEDWQGYQYGNGLGYESNWATPTRYLDPETARAELALPEYNSASMVRSVTIPKGTTMWEGVARAQFGQPGGGLQVWVTDQSSLIPGPWIPTFGG